MVQQYTGTSIRNVQNSALNGKNTADSTDICDCEYEIGSLDFTRLHMESEEEEDDRLAAEQHLAEQEARADCYDDNENGISEDEYIPMMLYAYSLYTCQSTKCIVPTIEWSEEQLEILQQCYEEQIANEAYFSSLDKPHGVSCNCVKCN